MQPLENKEIDYYFSRVVEVFKELGFPQKLISQWTLPQNDATFILKILRESQPHNILEVGTFVGLTSLLMALVSSPETHIHTIDPNFPLELEMESMGSNLYDSNRAMKTQELALKAAIKLGVENKITFHAGGFSTDNTFASYNTSSSSRVPTVGPEVCERYGSFDFIFIDGLHYEKDVFSDVNLATKYLLPSGFIALHDVLGPWGSNVRRAIYRFLEQNEDYKFSHARLSEVYNSIGLLRRYSKQDESQQKLNAADIRNSGLIQESMLSNLGAVLINKFSPSSVVQIGGSIALLELIKNTGLLKECAFVTTHQEIQHDSIPIITFNNQEGIHLGKKYDLCLCFEIMDTVDVNGVDNVIQACVDASDKIIFASTPPGELSSDQQKNKPLACWIRKFYEKGYLLSDEIRPILEPINYSDVLLPNYNYRSSYLMNLYLVTYCFKKIS